MHLKAYDLYFADFDLSFGHVGSFIVAIIVCFIMQLYINKNPMINVIKPKSDKLNTKVESLSIEEQVKDALKLLLK